jgi:hypothetical protein
VACEPVLLDERGDLTTLANTGTITQEKTSTGT